MKIKTIHSGELDDFVAAQPLSQFLQSSSWANFQKSQNKKTWFLGLVDGKNRLLATALIIEHKLALSQSYLYCPRGPIFETKLTEAEKEQALKLILSKARDITIETENSDEIFFRFEPTDNFQLLKTDCQPSKEVQPKNTLLIDLTQNEDKLLGSMHHKTRYNIRLAQKKNLEINQLHPKNFDQAWDLFKKTANRDKFNLHPKSYYKKMLQSCTETKLWLVSQRGVALAACLTSNYADVVTYLHGASNYRHRNLMAPYLLHWQIIKQAKENGFHYYDLHGIAPADFKANHPWAGLTRFKLGFGGQRQTFAGTYDFVYKPSAYKLYNFLRKFNRLVK